MVPNTRAIATHLTATLGEEWRPTNDVFVTAAAYGGKRYLWGINGTHGRPDEVAITDASNTLWRQSEDLVLSTYEPQVFFYLLGGSYFPDWNWCSQYGCTNTGFLRACLSTSTNGLAAVWARERLSPDAGPWKMDRLALGHHLGAMLQDTIAAYASQSSRTVFVLGDPTLTAFVTAPARNLSASTNYTGGFHVVLNWVDSSEEDMYYVYRGSSIENALTNSLACLAQNTTNYNDWSATTNQTHTYLVRAAKLVSTGAGSFHNLSRATTTNITIP
jgi:hypothetical protein